MLIQLFCLAPLRGQPGKTGAEPVPGINFAGSTIVVTMFRSVHTLLQEAREVTQLPVNLCGRRVNGSSKCKIDSTCAHSEVPVVSR